MLPDSDFTRTDYITKDSTAKPPTRTTRSPQEPVAIRDWLRRLHSQIEYPNYDLRLSGFLLGHEYIQGKGSIAMQKMGKGRVILFSMTPQFRAMTHGSYKLVFNAIFWAARQDEEIDMPASTQ